MNKSRARDIARYLDENRGSIPSAIILSAQDKAKLHFDKQTAKITFSVVKDSFLVIDGQHRLFGLIEAKNYYNIPVIIFTELNTASEVSLFIDINTTQKGVPSALLLDIKQLAGKETKREELQRELFDRLNENSPLAGLLSSSKSVAGKVSRTAFNEATTVIFETGPLSEQNIDLIYKGVKNYLEAAEYVLSASGSANAKLTKTTIFKALFTIFNETMNRSLQENGHFKPEAIKRLLEGISTLNFDDYTGTNKATIQRIVTDMRHEINRYSNVVEDMF